MSGVKITDLVPQETIDKIKELNTEIKTLLDTYTGTAKELAKGIDINVRVIGDVDKLEKLLVEKTKEATVVTEKLNTTISEQSKVINEQGKAIANTTNTRSRELMEIERVNKAQRAAYTDTDKFKTLMEKVNGSYEQRTRRLIQLEEEIKSAKDREKELTKEYERGEIDQKHYLEVMTELRMESRALAQEKAELTNWLKNEEREMQSVEGSYRNLSQRLELMKKAYKEFTESEKETPLGAEMEKAIQDLDAHLKDLAADMGEHQRNVGNYAIATVSLKKNYEELVIALATLQSQYDKLTEAEKASEAGQKLASQLQETANAARNAKTALDEQNQAVDEARRSLGESGKADSGIKKDLKELVLEIANLSIEYQNLSDAEKESAEGQALADHINDLIERAGVLKDAIADTNAAINNAASDTRGFDQLGGALQLAIDGFGLATGAAEMLGISTGELEEIQTKLQAAIAASNAMQSIQNSLQSQTALMQGVNLIQTKLRTTAENLHTAAQGRGLIATKALTVAQWAFNAAANANPIGLVVVAIVACIAAVWGLVKAFQAFFGTSADVLRQYEQQKQALEDLCDANDKMIERMKARGAVESDLLNQSILNKKEEKKAAENLFARAKELYDEDEDEYKECLEAKKKADEEYEAFKEDGLQYLLKIQAEAKARERENEIGTLAYKLEIIQAEKEKQLELAYTLYQNSKITRQMYDDIVASVNKAAEFKIADVKEAENKKNNDNRAKDAKKQAEELKKAVKAGEDALLNIITDSLERQTQVEILSYNRRLKELEQALAKTKKTEVTMRKALYNQIEGLKAEHERKMLEIEISQLERSIHVNSELTSSHLLIVEAGSKEEYELKLKALSNQYDAELLEIQKGENDKIYTQQQAQELRENLAIRHADDIVKLQEEYAGKQAEIIMERYATEEIIRNEEYSKAVNALKDRYAKELALAAENAQKQEELKRQLENDLFNLQVQYSQQSAEASIRMIEEILKLENLSAEDRLKWENKLAQAKINLANQVTDANREATEKQIADDARLRDERMKNLQSWMQTASQAIGSIGSLVSTLYDGKIEKIEAEQQANEEAGERDQERISRLVEQKVITEEEGEARKRAAAAKTEKKNEELEKKKAALQYKQAVFQKATDLAQAGIATALAITQALPNVVMAAIVGAMGAVQIATILATPIPKYAKGTDFHPGGPAIVGDGGRHEVVIFKGSAWITPDTPTLVDIPAGAMVLPDINPVDDGITPTVMLPLEDKAGGTHPYDDTAMRRGVMELISLKRQQIRLQRRDFYSSRHNYNRIAI